MRWFIALFMAAAVAGGCRAPDPRPTAEDIVCLCKGDLGCVCVRVDGETPRSEYQGVTYYFCANTCKTEFDKNPAKWVDAYRKLKK